MARHHSHSIHVCLPKATVALLLLLSLVLNGSLFLSHFGIFDSEPSLPLSLRSSWEISQAGLTSGVLSRRKLHLLVEPVTQSPRTPTAPSSVSAVSSSIEVEIPTATLPLWMTEYLLWHRERRRTLNLQNWQESKYLVVRCLRHDVPCGGLSDRLRHVPLALWIAAQTERLLLIHWELPAPLELFLVPPSLHNNSNSSSSNSNSLDWRIPSWLLDEFQFATRPTVTKVPEIPAALLDTSNYNNTNAILLDMRLQSYKEASVYYNTHAVSNSTELTDSTDFNAIFRPVWNLLFTPSPAVADLLTSHLQWMHLQPGEYAAAHTRTLYHFNLTGSDLQHTVENAINCAAQLSADSNSNTNTNPAIQSTAGLTPERILLASDSLTASQLAVAYGQGRVVSQSTTTDDNNNGISTQWQTPLHLDREADFLQHHEHRGVLLQHQTALPASAYYNVFVDLYLLANSRCVTYDRGGFGKLGSLLSTNASCFVRHKTKKCRPMLDSYTSTIPNSK
jgi:hypothetical protein